ncbi:MAG: hypothetical protein ACREQL_05105 [Candidatus Binatia bacterium]
MRRVTAVAPPSAGMERWRLAFASAIAADGRAMLYVAGGANEGDRRWITLPEAVRSGRPYFVRVHPAVLAVDADERDAVQRVATLAHRLTAACLRPVIVASGQLGRAHLFCRVGGAEMRAHAVEAATTLGLDARATIRPPLAPHRLAGCSYPRQPKDWRIALAALAVVPPRRGPLSPAMQKVLRGDK